ncbi:hypothetical protein GGI22_004589 [Coemansia erecta]|nr:hypothetical protein GGI22_004589 [Coemansia erecta]
MRPHRQAPPSFPSLDPNEEEDTQRIGNEQLYQTPDTYTRRDVEMMSVDRNDAAARSTGGPRLGGHYTGVYTPPTQVAAGAVGRRLDLAAIPPRFALAHEVEEEEARPSGTDSMEDYYAPLARKQPPRQPSSPDDPMYQTGEGSFPTPAGFARLQQQQQQPLQAQPQEDNGEVQVDQDFVLSLRQEGELEALTRKAMKDARGAWKQMTMDYLHKQVAGLEEDEWMYT